MLELGANSFPPLTTYKSSSPSLSESKKIASTSSNTLCTAHGWFLDKVKFPSIVCKNSCDDFPEALPIYTSSKLSPFTSETAIAGPN